jgi:hypothetical protein
MMPTRLFEVDMLARYNLVDILAIEYSKPSPTYDSLTSLFSKEESHRFVNPDSFLRRFRKEFELQEDNMRHSLLEPKFQGPGAGASIQKSIWVVE